MSSIEKMNLIQLSGEMDSLDTALEECCSSGVFQIVTPPEGTTGDFHSMNESNPFTPLLQKALGVLKNFQIEPAYHELQDFSMSNDEISSYLENVGELGKNLSDEISSIRDALSIQSQAADQLRHLKGLPVKIQDLTASHSMTARFGRLPAANFEKLEFFKRQTFFFFDFDHDQDHYWGVYVAPNSEIKEVDQLFKSLYFEVIDLPDFLKDTPEASAVLLEERMKEEENQKELAETKQTAARKQHENRLLSIYAYLKVKNDVFNLRKYVSESHHKFFLEGFVPAEDSEAFIHRFDAYPLVICNKLNPSEQPQLDPPVRLKTPKFFKPFEMFVKMYGLPDYYGFNPTSLIAVIYILLFGIMFADLGQGFLLAVGGFILYKVKKMDLAGIISRCGISSMIFGTLFGSVFGFEDLLDPVYEKLGISFLPLKVFDSATTNHILYGVVGIGMVIILTVIILNIRLSLKKKNYESALFSNNGIAGLVLYGSVVITVILMMIFKVNILNPFFIIICFVLPLLIMLMREPLANLVNKKPATPEGGFGSYLLQNIFELIEIIISYVSNTLSFMRVGGFVLSHAGMMLVVKTLAEMVGSGGSPFVWVFGNLFVMALEGFIVAIQVLRLVYYETFNRFYTPDGKEFEPTTISYDEPV